MVSHFQEFHGHISSAYSRRDSISDNIKHNIAYDHDYQYGKMFCVSHLHHCPTQFCMSCVICKDPIQVPVDNEKLYAYTEFLPSIECSWGEDISDEVHQ